AAEDIVSDHSLISYALDAGDSSQSGFAKFVGYAKCPKLTIIGICPCFQLKVRHAPSCQIHLISFVEELSGTFSVDIVDKFGLNFDLKPVQPIIERANVIRPLQVCAAVAVGAVKGCSLAVFVAHRGRIETVQSTQRACV